MPTFIVVPAQAEIYLEALLLNQLDYLLTDVVVVKDLIIHISFEKKGVLPLFSQ
jgi:hypothetical protein